MFPALRVLPLVLLAACPPSEPKDVDADGDGYFSSEDCDDGDAAIHPGATESWYDSIDQDCSDTSDFDADADGYDSSVYGGPDCDDTDPGLNPGAPEVWYDGLDQDCNLENDGDADGDGHDAEVVGGDDCDDQEATTYPGAPDAWYDGADSNCDGINDYDADADGYDSDDHGGDDCDDQNEYVHPGTVETWYDGVDQDCGGGSDMDADQDGHDSEAYAGDDCDDTDPTYYDGAPETWYDGLDQDCRGGDDWDADGDGHQPDWYGGDDCDDEAAVAYPGATEIWYDGIDGDCEGGDDFDLDGDDDPYPADCDDADRLSHAGAAERCDGKDNNCDGVVDNDPSPDWYLDDDGDGWGDPDVNYGDCTAPAPLYTDDVGDCDDSDPDIHPDAEDPCDGVDQDCDSFMDEDGGCPCTQSIYGPSSFLYCTKDSDWSTARAACATIGYDLASVTGSAESAWVTSVAALMSAGDSWWIGLSDSASEGTWIWSDGSALAFTNWSSGQPDDASGSEDCVEMSPSGTWSDDTCSTLNQYICEASTSP